MVRKILVVDDDKLIRWSLKEIFLGEGYSVDEAASSGEAETLAEGSSFNLVFADLEIADENGIEMLKRIQKIQPEAIIIILSALNRHQIEAQLGHLNVFSILEKPFKSEKIRSIAREALDSKIQE